MSLIEIKLAVKNRPFCPACGKATKIISRENINNTHECLVIACAHCCQRYQVSREIE